MDKRARIARMSLTAWESTVASAAPAAPIPKEPMRRKSRPMLRMPAAATYFMGLFVSPRPRKIAEATL